MLRLRLKFLLACLTLCFSLGVRAADAPAPLTIEDFARKPVISRVELSPDGKYFSGMMYLRGLQTLAIDEIDSEDRPYLIAGDNWDIRWYQWMGPTDILMGVALPSAIQGAPVIVTRLVHADVASRKMRMLFGKDDNRGFFQIQDRVLSFLPDKPDRFLISASRLDPGRPRVYEATFKQSRLPRSAVQKSMDGVKTWWADALGNVRAGIGHTADQQASVFTLKSADGAWQDYSALYDDGFEVAALPTFDQDLVYAKKPNEGGFRPLWLFNVATGEWVEEVASSPNSDISSVGLSRDGQKLLWVNFENEAETRIIFDEWYKALNDTIDKLYPETRNGIAAMAENESRGVMVSRSGSIPDHYYLFDKEKKSMSFLQTSYPSLHDRAPGRVHAVTFTARDGLTIPGYVTLPKDLGLDDKPNIPFVVHPHGGPHARDFERFDWLVQMMVARGYGVLQLNFRGSTGYGLEFLNAGKKEWGQAMQDDITDGTNWLVEQGLADGERLCIVGGSYGGYAAAMGLAKEPDLYQCGVSLNGVFDIVGLVKSKSRFIGGRFATRFIGNLWKDRAALVANSPINLVDQIKAPLLIVHGEDDRVVRVRQSRRMSNAMPQARYVELPNGDHSISRPDNRLKFSQELMDFLGKHLGNSTYSLF
ncbi:MAG: prolyl oligopeptidase family serine peptidase [Pseudomonadales bacterium]|nr:prolyl oligopeptidase family serine peptidase [Pseudomonadales bacterium]